MQSVEEFFYIWVHSTHYTHNIYLCTLILDGNNILALVSLSRPYLILLHEPNSYTNIHKCIITIYLLYWISIERFMPYNDQWRNERTKETAIERVREWECRYTDRKMVKNLPHGHSKYRWLLLHDWFYWIVYLVLLRLAIYVYTNTHWDKQIDWVDNHWLCVNQFDCKTKAHESNNNENKYEYLYRNEKLNGPNGFVVDGNAIGARLCVCVLQFCFLYANSSHEPQNQT